MGRGGWHNVWNIERNGVYLGASLTSMAASSPMAVWMITSSENVCELEYSGGVEEDQRALLTDILALILEHAENAFTNLTRGNLDIVLGVTIILQEGKKVIIGDIQLQKMSIKMNEAQITR